MSQTFDLNAALADAERESQTHPHAQAIAQALAAPHAAKSYADPAPLKAAVTGKPLGVLVTFLLKNLGQLLATYGPQALQWLLDYISKQVAGGTGTTPTAPAPTQ
jgi:hypothetical protein